MKLDKNILKLYAITDRSYLNNENLAFQVEKAILGGTTIIQVREKKMNEQDFIKEALTIKKVCDKYQIPLIINDNVNVAIKTQANGVHVGQNDQTTSEVRNIIDDNMILGVSVNSVRQALQAEKDGADYLGVGAIFPTSSKDDATLVSIEILTKICQSVKIPVVAIGGITKNNIKDLNNSGIVGVALISAIFGQNDIKKSCHELIEIIDNKLLDKEI
ncbi:MAG: thiamine phosphate synthase [Bacilli bacterium]|jgi:thiamine-phosphate pyrophosphorylase|nr:thiamine phosphate synthase [Bacilli bacterium]